ncbi:glycosyl hydrolase 115 family protein [Flammeovirgaceae bacterium SG7u.111]|nr:glycosyl hydrolase 115 family protein [Flammeovirgaceae bacterium SG7u.132]WPO38524.1 glycosyl hydrolase 115 family protein [Flammeovirgaceae bacterium SG7u.111]
MIRKYILCSIQPLCILLFFTLNLEAKSSTFEIYEKGGDVTSILYDREGSSLDSITAFLLAKDIYNVVGKRPLLTTLPSEVKGNCIVIGEINSKLITSLLHKQVADDQFLTQKESYLYKIIESPFSKQNKCLVIAGTDPRGTAFGVFDLSKKIGVSPWYWWADVPVQKNEELVIEQDDFYSKEPSVAYRGIFLNDEDWGLQPWAAKTFEPEIGDIGPKTYAKIFELLLRLKANMIWPAMHPSTKAFFHYPGNPKIAELYDIVLGSSHAEPMLRNNVDEWKKDSLGAFNYVANKETVINYWDKRVEEAKNIDGIYTMGMRGVHDSGMEGVKSIEQAAQVLDDVIATQRGLLEKHLDKKITDVPQVFTVYKEVLALYDHGLNLPEDITIMWTDDNYGYIRRLSDEEERKRLGGGVYYHASYWGRPHDYLWLNTTSPALIREEMLKAYQTNSRKIWILNVGDIKPAEYTIDLFMDMAFDTEKYLITQSLDHHSQAFYTSIFGNELGKEISSIQKEYYHLAFERKPEFMGWNQTEPTKQVNLTDYTPFYWGDEIDKRLADYKELEEGIENLQQQLPKSLTDTYFELVYYPVKSAALMNKKSLYRDKALKYSEQNRLIAEDFKTLSASSYDSIQSLTNIYNTSVSNGKWNNMMHPAPRNLPVFQKPEINLEKGHSTNGNAGISVENNSVTKTGFALPTFYPHSDQSHFLDLYLTKEGKVSWAIEKIPDWALLTSTKGELDSSSRTLQQRVYVKIDGGKWRAAKQPSKGKFKVKMGKEAFSISLNIKEYQFETNKSNLFVEENGVVSIYAENFTGKADYQEFSWEQIPNLGYSDQLMQASPLTEMPLDTLQLKEKAPYLSYSIFTESVNENTELIIHALPTHPITNKHSVRIGVQWDDDPIRMVDFRTQGRSETWKLNVLSNLAKVKIPLSIEEVGKHELKIFMVDEGVALDFFYLNMKNVPLPYALLDETRY